MNSGVAHLRVFARFRRPAASRPNRRAHNAVRSSVPFSPISSVSVCVCLRLVFCLWPASVCGLCPSVACLLCGAARICHDPARETWLAALHRRRADRRRDRGIRRRARRPARGGAASGHRGCGQRAGGSEPARDGRDERRALRRGHRHLHGDAEGAPARPGPDDEPRHRAGDGGTRSRGDRSTRHERSAARPSLIPAHLFLGSSYLALGQPEKAVAPLERASAARPTDVESLGLLAQARLATGDVAARGRSVSPPHRARADAAGGVVRPGAGLERASRSRRVESFDADDPDSPWRHLLVADALARRPAPRRRARPSIAPRFAALPSHASRCSKRWPRSISGADARRLGEGDRARAPRRRRSTAWRIAPSVTCGPDAIAPCSRRPPRRTDAESRYWRARAATALTEAAFATLDKLPDSRERREMRAELAARRESAPRFGRRDRGGAEVRAGRPAAARGAGHLALSRARLREGRRGRQARLLDEGTRLAVAARALRRGAARAPAARRRDPRARARRRRSNAVRRRGPRRPRSRLRPGRPVRRRRFRCSNRRSPTTRTACCTFSWRAPIREPGRPKRPPRCSSATRRCRKPRREADRRARRRKRRSRRRAQGALAKRRAQGLQRGGWRRSAHSVSHPRAEARGLLLDSSDRHARDRSADFSTTCFAPLGHTTSMRSTIVRAPRPKCSGACADEA